MLIDKIRSLDDNLIVKENESMKNHTSFKVGGPVDFLLIPSSVDKLIEIVNIMKLNNKPYLIIGKGTNIIVTDKGIRGFLIKTTGLINTKVHENVITSETGVTLAKLSSIAFENGLSGMEFASGIPGTLGGAIGINAGAYGGEIKDIIEYTEFIDNEGEIQIIKGKAHHFGYRHSLFQYNGGIILRAGIKLKSSNKIEIKNRMLEYNKRRKENQPLEMPCAGSIFKRPVGYFAGKLIEDSGLKGYKIGGAMVSHKHCGFIVNSDNATASDIISLIEYIQNEVFLKFGVLLEREVKIIGEDI